MKLLDNNDNGRKFKTYKNLTSKACYVSEAERSGFCTHAQFEKTIQEIKLNPKHWEWKTVNAEKFGGNKNLGTFKCVCCNEHQKWRNHMLRHTGKALTHEEEEGTSIGEEKYSYPSAQAEFDKTLPTKRRKQNI